MNGKRYIVTEKIENRHSATGYVALDWYFYDKFLAEQCYEDSNRAENIKNPKVNDGLLLGADIKEEELPLMFTAVEVTSGWSPRENRIGLTKLGTTSNMNCSQTYTWYTASNDLESAKKAFAKKKADANRNSAEYYSRLWV